MSKFLVNLFMLKTRLIVNTYTATTLPFYYALQKPRKVLEVAKRLRTRKFVTSEGALVLQSDEEFPTTHPSVQYNTYAEVLNNLNKYYDPNRQVLGQRQVISERTENDENGNPIRINGKTLRKFVLSDTYKWLTFKEVFEKIDNIAKGLSSMGVKSGDKVIIWADTRQEWMLCCLALIKLNATIATLLSNLGTSGLTYAINQTEAKTIITSFDLLAKLQSFLNEVPNVKSIVYIKNTNNDEIKKDSIPSKIDYKSLEDVEQLGLSNKLDVKFEVPSNPEETAVIMYNSGSTGNPKAVCMTHKSLMANYRMQVSNIGHIVAEADRHIYMSFLPLSNIFGFSVEMFSLFCGVKIGYSSALTMTDASPRLAKGQKGDVSLLRPTSTTAVPLVLDRILNQVYEKLNDRSPLAAPLFTYLMEYKIRWKGRGYDTPIINRLICKKISDSLGGRMESMIVAGAPLNARTQAIIKAAFNIDVLSQGYGLTECCGGATAMPVGDLTYGTIGIPLRGVNIKLIDWEEGGYLTNDEPNPRGELVIGGDIISDGYYKLPEMTNESFYNDKDGLRWFETGDIGEVLPNGSVKIIDRKKDLTKLSSH